MSRRRVLTWKIENGPEGAGEEGDPNDVGPAWIDTYQDDEHLSEEKVAGGEWITRAEACRLAEANGYDRVEDDGNARPVASSPGDVGQVDVAAINELLRSAGVSEDELRVDSQA